MSTWYRVLMTPWRYAYIRETTSRPEGAERRCLFCELASMDPSRDEDALVLVRGSSALVVMNMYPYNTGHLMVAPYKHVATFEGLSDDELLELLKLVRASMRAIKRVYGPDGFNVGVNVGRAAGAGIEDHLHIHIVPRWVGDTSFITIVSATKTVPQDLRDTYRALKPVLEEEVVKEGLRP